MWPSCPVFVASDVYRFSFLISENHLRGGAGLPNANQLSFALVKIHQDEFALKIGSFLGLGMIAKKIFFFKNNPACFSKHPSLALILLLSASTRMHAVSHDPPLYHHRARCAPAASRSLFLKKKKCLSAVSAKMLKHFFGGGLIK